jgi:uracil phosphoribosyltransferase
MSKQKKNSRAELAEHLSAVLRHPETPVDLFNAIADELTELLEYDWTRPEMIQRALDDDARVRQESEAAH